jgi:hypothetical protein
MTEPLKNKLDIEALKKLIDEFNPHDKQWSHNAWIHKVFSLLYPTKIYYDFMLCDDYFYDDQCLHWFIRGYETALKNMR